MVSGMTSRSSFASRKKWSTEFLLLKMTAVYSVRWIRDLRNSEAVKPTTSKNLKKVMSTLYFVTKFL